MEDEWMEALHRYVSEGQWSEVSHFVDRNAVLFGGSSTEKEHGEGEYALYVQFRSLVAKVLDSLLEELGCRSEADEARLAIFLRETAESPASGPREEMAKRVLQDLLDIDDFAAFARTMRARNDELETGEAVELERQLSAAADAKARATPETPLGAKHSVFSDSDADLTPVTTPGGGVDWQWSTVWEEAFESAEAANDDFELQHATALSLLEAHERGALPDKDRPFVGWAQALVAVASEMNGLHWAQEPRRARRLHSDLVRQRFAVELRVAQEAAFEDSAARAEAAQSAAVGGDDERSACVAAALARCETLRGAVAVARGRCVRNGAVRDANLELGYLTIRGLLHRREDLPSHATEIYDALTSRAEAEAEAHRRGDAAGPDGDGDGDIGDIGDGRRGARGAAPSAIAADLVAWCALEAELGTVQKRLHGMLGDDGASDQAKAAAVWKLAARRGADDKAAEDEGSKDGAYDAGGGAVSSDGDVLWHEFLDLDTNYCYYVNTATGESQWNPPDEFLPLDESVEVAAGLAEEQAAAYHAEAAHAAYKEELPTSEYWDEPKAAKDPPRAPEADAAPAEAKAEAKDDGPTFKEMNIGERSIEYEGKKMQFDAVYAGLSDEGFFAAACEPVLECDRGTFLCSGACAEVSKAIAFFADAFETASAVDVREDRVWDVLANGELAVDSKTKKFRPAAEAAARDERCRCGGVPDAHRLVFLARPAKGALCVAALASGDDTKTQQGLAALVNVLTSKEPADRRPYQDSKLTKLLDGGWLDSFVVLCVFVGRETDTADAATRLKHASRLRRLSSAGPAAADAMFESLKSRAMRTKHEEETGRLKREHM
ncbi:hypothetical protein AURANDRAFT_67725 [Aureococcus anophagefferens]|uniref:Cilia- and flagella-associated protein 36 n=1 Tax=Aureococcus anophagefferens TaxID=44056 RepID=F0YM63_AURAN|nr:hypothetical protein AURANDRAFT_67725 [Aureococcus anophagefferens]EGB03797.1 hypothetical protein AURANDRAFT_67725 [Aureococcus anophagefferens]|eukprot:XP_009041526.1 hypothetical protein AURANDRAFT_67725 [Aureococcus anophagefferens]